MKNKKIVAFIMIVCMLFVMTACDGVHSSPKKITETVKIVYPISRGMGEKDISALQTWFNEKYPDAKLEMVSANVTTVSDTVRSDFKNGNGADIFVTTEYDAFIREGLLADITDVQAAVKFRKSSMRELERNGKIYALPIGGGSLVGLHYNKTLFEEYGIELPNTSENFEQLVERIEAAIEEKNIDVDVLRASMLYPSQVSVIYNSIFSEATQRSSYLKWVADYDDSDSEFTDELFQKYLEQIDVTMKNKWFASEDLVSSQSASIESFLKGNSFLYIGDVKRCYDTMTENADYQRFDIEVSGIPVGEDGVSYISYMDDLYIGVNKDYDGYSKEKKEIIDSVLNYIVSGDNSIKNIFTITGAYSSVYFEGQAVEILEDPYFDQINRCLENNYVAQEVSNTPFSYIFGRALIAWRSGRLDDFMKNGDTSIKKVTEILNKYKTENINVFEKSEETIGKSKSYMEYQSNIVRSQETVLGNQVADMAKSYMNSDFALINAGGIRASIPEGNVSEQTFNSVLPYSNYLVKIKVSGATLKKALENAYNVGPLFKSGQFGEISGLKVELRTKPEGYEKYRQQMDEWNKNHPDAGKMEQNDAAKQIIERICENNPNMLNLEIVSITDDKGNEIEDDKFYMVATLDYLLKNQDGYSMLGILSDSPEADNTIKVYDRSGNLIDGTMEEVEEKVTEKCKTIAESFIEWIREGNEPYSTVDGRIKIDNFISIE